MTKPDRWPYPGLLPFALKTYPVVQLAPRIGPKHPRRWPPPMDPAVAAWQADLDGDAEPCNQIYIHVPFCPFQCNFCPLYKLPRRARSETLERFTDALIAEIRLRALRRTDNVFGAVYFGGGTPTELEPRQLKRILAALRAHFRIAPDAEITLEGVARTMLGSDYLPAALDAGFNRLSFGVQTLDRGVRKRIGRGDDVADYAGLMDALRALAPHVPVNVDLLLGLPGQSLASLEADLREVQRWGVSSVDVLNYMMLPGTRSFDRALAGTSPLAAFGARLLEARKVVQRSLRSGGYVALTAEVYARNDRDRFTQSSFGGGGPSALNTVLALGPSAFGLVDGYAYQNIGDLERYADAVERGELPTHSGEALSLKTARRRALVLATLRLRIPSRLLTGRRERAALRRWVEAGLTAPRGEAYELTDRGMLWFNHMQLEVLPLTARVRALRMLGSADDWGKLRSAGAGSDLARYRQEILRLVRGSGRLGPARQLGYQALVGLAQRGAGLGDAVRFSGRASTAG